MPLTTPFTGRRSDVGITKESSRGTTGATVDYWLPYAAYSFNEKVAKAKDDTGLGTIETPRTADLVKRWTEGDIEFNIRDKSVGLLLLSLFGTETFSVDTPVSGAGQHTFTVAESNQHQSLSVWKKNPVETLQAGNCMVTSFQLNAVLDQYVRGSVGLIGKLFGNDVATVSYTAENRFRPQDLVIKLAATANEIAGASAISTVRHIAFTFNKNVEDYQGLGSVDPVDFVNRDFTVTGEFEIAFENDTYKDLVLLSSFKALSVKMSNAGAIVVGTTNPSLEFIFDQLEFDSFDLTEANENVAVLKASFSATYSQANSRMVRAILINSKNTAY